MNAHVIRAIFKRNFVSYFSNPTGYVFICVFVLLSSLAAFWPNEFFIANLANLDELTTYLPYIMLVFIPAITMSIWAEERRQGTDELLLTIPAADFDVVLGKYLAAVAIFTVSLVFSLVCNLVVLWTLGQPDVGLFLATYFGYWMVGLAMLAIGMVASFLTNNLTVGFILGMLFNVPLVLAAWPDAIVRSPHVARVIKDLSIASQLRDFSRGVVSLSSIAYFMAIVALMLYLSMVLIGRRHWRGGREGRSMAGHYLGRFLALVVVVVCVTIFFARHDRLRADVSSEQLSSLSPKTRELVAKLDNKHPVRIEAYVSESVPESFVTTKLNLLSTLRELEALGGDKIDVTVHEVPTFSEEVSRAEQQFGIKPQMVPSTNRGARTQEEILMGVAFTCGLEKVVVPFLGKGIPVEYELVRSISTVSQQTRKKLGVLTTDAKLFSSFDMQSFVPSGDQLIVDELKKQYNVVQVDPTNAITEKYDVLLAVQPSSLGPQQMDHFIAAVKSGQPTAIFEDPLPFPARGFFPEVVGTAAQKQPPGGMNPFMQQRQPPQPKGDISKLWDVLGIDFKGNQVVWQDYNPYSRFQSFITREWVFVDTGAGAKQPFNAGSPISAGLQQLLFIYPGSITGLNSSTLKFTQLISTSDQTGFTETTDLMTSNFMGSPQFNPEAAAQHRHTTGEEYIIAARIQGKLKPENMLMSDKPAEPPPAAKGEPGKSPAAPAPPKPSEINVVLVADIDCLSSIFFSLRARGDEAEDEVKWDFDNVTFVLNILDDLAKDDRFVPIRARRPSHRTLTKLTEATNESRRKADEEREQYQKRTKAALDEERKKLKDYIAALQKRTGLNPQQAAIEVQTAMQEGQARLDTKTSTLNDARDKSVKELENKLALEIHRVQDRYKMAAVLVPPIPPLLVALYVFFNRRAREREGVAKSRLR